MTGLSLAQITVNSCMSYSVNTWKITYTRWPWQLEVGSCLTSIPGQALESTLAGPGLTSPPRQGLRPVPERAKHQLRS